jgi:hypothetical protein
VKPAVHTERLGHSSGQQTLAPAAPIVNAEASIAGRAVITHKGGPGGGEACLVFKRLWGKVEQQQQQQQQATSSVVVVVVEERVRESRVDRANSSSSSSDTIN